MNGVRKTVKNRIKKLKERIGEKEELAEETVTDRIKRLSEEVEFEIAEPEVTRVAEIEKVEEVKTGKISPRVGRTYSFMKSFLDEATGGLSRILLPRAKAVFKSVVDEEKTYGELLDEEKQLYEIYSSAIQEQHPTMAKLGRIATYASRFTVPGIGMKIGKETGEAFAKRILTKLARRKGERFIKTKLPAKATEVIARKGLTALTGGIEFASGGALTELFKETIGDPSDPIDIKRGLRAAKTEAQKDFVVGAVLSGLGSIVTDGLEKVGERIFTSNIKVSDRLKKEGFNAKKIIEKDLDGTLKGTLEKIGARRADLYTKLNELIAGKPGLQIDANKLLNSVQKIMLTKQKQLSHGKTIKELVPHFKRYRELVKQISGKEGRLTLPELQQLKQVIGNDVAFLERVPDVALQTRKNVANEFYQILKKQIERKALPGVREVNRELSDMIPIEQAIISTLDATTKRRLLDGYDAMIGFAGLWEPKLWGVIALRKIGQSPATGSVIRRTGKQLKMSLN